MSGAGILALGALAGFTIFLGLPLGRMRTQALSIRAFLNAGAIGILLFLFVDIVEHAYRPVEESVEDGAWGAFSRYAVILVAGLVLGLMALVYYERWMGRRTRSIGPGAAAVAEFAARTDPLANTPARRLALLIATGIGLHNFAEGLAIGQSAAAGTISLAVLLVIGFGLHNATEGFGIVGPLAGEPVRPSWKFLGLLGLIGGGPTFLGTLVGQSFVNETVSVGFLALAAGSILYVIVQLVGVATRIGRKELLYWGLLVGLAAGLATELVIEAAGV